MAKLGKNIKEKIENYILKNEGGVKAKWTDEDVLTTFDENGEALDDYAVYEDEGDYYYTAASLDYSNDILIEFD